MAYRHSVNYSEVPTSITPPVNTAAGLPVIVGTAPVHLASDPVPANTPLLCYNYGTADAGLGYSEDWNKYTLCEPMYSQFFLFNRAPVIFINVLDPAVHKAAVAQAEKTIDSDGTVVLTDPVIPATLVVKKTASGDALVRGTDYDFAWDSKDRLVISVLEGGALDGELSMFVNYDKVDASAVTAADIIGGVDSTTGAKKGLECLNDIFTMFGMVPGVVLAPGWSENPEVAAVIKAKSGNINEHFKALSLTDIPTSIVKKYSDAVAWKNNNSYTGVDQVVCWPMAKLGEKIFHISSMVLGAIAQTDSANRDVPYESPSNKELPITGLCLSDGTEVRLALNEAEYLNGQGIVTAINFIGGWRTFGNRTGCYPGNTDPKDAFISSRRMVNWHGQTFILTYWQKLDKPTNKRLVQNVVDSENIRLNGLTASGALLGGRVEFLEEENPITDLIDGKIKFHTYLGLTVPARDIEDIVEFDTSYFNTLFS
jgi:phage tail sheath protein FI